MESPHRLCEQGKALTAEQAQLLKLIGEKMVVFRVGLRARWDSATGAVEDVTDPGVRLDVDVDVDADADADADADSEETEMGGEDDDEAISE